MKALLAEAPVAMVHHPDMMFSAGCRDFLHYMVVVHGYAAGTADNYGRTYAQFSSFLRERGLPDHTRHFTSDQVFAFCEALGHRGMSGNTIVNKLNALRSLGAYLLKRKDGRNAPAILMQPTAGFDWPKMTQCVTSFLYPPELAALMALPLDPETSLLRAVLAETGIRALEACEACVGDVKELEGATYLTLKVKGRRGGHQEPASIPLSEGTAALVRAQTATRCVNGPETPLFLTRTGRRYKRTQLSQLFIRLGQRAGITRVSTSPHKLRHTANVIARISGIDPLTRAAMLNHRSMRTLARYEHLVPGETARGRVVARQGLDRYLAEGEKQSSSKEAS